MVSNASTTPASVRAKRSISSITAPERLKSALKEKEQKIEQLMKERELERAEIAKAALQTDEAESQLVHIKREYLSYKGASAEEMKNLTEKFRELESNLQSTKIALEDEKKKNEDLQFKIEEDELMRENESGESEKIKNLEEQLKVKEKNSEFENRIKILENELGMERKISANHQSIVEQLNNLTLELEQLRSSKSQLESQLTSMEKSKEDELFEASEQMAQLNSNLENSQRDLKEAQNELAREKTQLENLRENLKSQSDTNVDVVNNLEKENWLKDEKIIELEHKLETYEKSSNSSSQILETKNEEIKAEKAENANLRLNFSKIETELKNAQDQNNELKSQVEQTKSLRDDLEIALKNAKSTITQSEKNFEKKIKEVEELKVQSEKSGTETQKELQKKTEELLKNVTKLTEANDLLESFKEVNYFNF